MIIEQKKIKLTYIFTHPIRWVPFELDALYIDQTKFEIDYVILNNNDPMINFLEQQNIAYTVTTFSDYSDTPEVVKFLHDHLVKNKTDIVHTHWIAGSFAGMQAAYYAKVPVRVFTREHPSIQYYTRHPLSRHRLIWECSTNAIAVTKKSKRDMIKDGIPAEKITLIPTGFDICEYENVGDDRVEKLRTKYLGNHQGPIIGVAARYVQWKGVEYVIKAHEKILETYPNALLVLSGTGVDRASLDEKMRTAHKEDIVSPQYQDILSITEKLSQLPSNSYVEITFESDLHALFKLFDVFVHAPIDDINETFGQVYVDAALSKVPSVITLAGSAADFAVHLENAWIVDYQNSEQIAEGVLTLLSDRSLGKKLASNAFLSAKEYNIKNHIEQLENFYLCQLQEKLNQ
jgi:glycosyltransferase involved in cell wall biosynthesis